MSITFNGKLTNYDGYNACCNRKRCDVYTGCTGDYELKPNAASIEGFTGSSCCQRKPSAGPLPDRCTNTCYVLTALPWSTKCALSNKECSACPECS